MRDYSKESGNICYKDCEECIHTFGEKACLECNYYEGCMVQREIDEYELAHDRELDRVLSRLEDGELI